MQLEGIPHSILGAPGIGHAHFWDRALSRRRLMQAAGAAGLALAGGRLLRPAAGWAAPTGSGAEPRPIPGGFATVDGRRWHAYPPGPSNPLDPSSVMNEPSAITDFDGLMTIAQVQGTGTEVRGGQLAGRRADRPRQRRLRLWTATGPAAPVRSDAHGCAGEFRTARATVAWSGRTEGSRYESDPPGRSKTVFAVVGRERNGVFLP